MAFVGGFRVSLGKSDVFGLGAGHVRGGRSVCKQRNPCRLTMSDDKAVVKEYFNTKGFERWNRIYSEDGEVNSVQLDIRSGHQITIDTILQWIDEDGNVSAKTICDAGCGVGSLALPLAERGATVFASDISDAMVIEARKRAQNTLVKPPPHPQTHLNPSLLIPFVFPPKQKIPPKTYKHPFRDPTLQKPSSKLPISNPFQVPTTSSAVSMSSSTTQAHNLAK